MVGTPLLVDEQFYHLPDGAKNLIGFWMRKAQTHPAKSTTSWFAKYHNSQNCMVWNEYVKERIIKQLPKIRKWRVLLGVTTLLTSNR